MRLRAMTIVLLLAVLLPATALAVVPLPADLSGELDGQPYRIRVPANWNGTLLVYSYGFAEGGFSPVPLTPLGTRTAAGIDEGILISKGYALAGIRAAGGVMMPIQVGTALAGWNMKERIQSQVALTSLFRDTVGQPQRTIAWGKSMGGLVALALVERYPGLFDGAVPLCAPAAGTPRFFDEKLDVVLAFKVAFGWDDAWGTPGNLRPDLNVMTEVAPVMTEKQTPCAWEFLRRVNGIPDDPSFSNFRPQVIWLAFAPLVDMERRARGRAVQNAGRLYELTSTDVEELEALGCYGHQSMLATMNQERFYAECNARNYAEHYYNPSGRISRPVLMLHTTHDAAVIPENEGAYFKLVDDQGNSGLLMQAYTTGIGAVNTHCTFLPAQYIAALDAMVWWLENGQKPDPEVYFPAAAGFDPTFVPDPWPW